MSEPNRKKRKVLAEPLVLTKPVKDDGKCPPLQLDRSIEQGRIDDAQHVLVPDTPKLANMSFSDSSHPVTPQGVESDLSSLSDDNIGALDRNISVSDVGKDTESDIDE